MSNRGEQFGRIGVLMGGVSSERDISLKSGKAVAEALGNQGCHFVSLDIVDDAEDSILALLREADINLAFNALHGHLGEDGVIQSILDKAGIPYTGSGVNASRLAFNKAETQELLEDKRIRVPSFRIYSKEDRIDLGAINGEFECGPVMVKPAREGSSFGITLVHERGELEKAMAHAWEFDSTILVEQYIQGRELTVGILGEQALPVVEIIPRDRFFTYEAKYKKGATDYVVPAKISDSCAAELKRIALNVHQWIGCEDLSRVDFMLDRNEESYVLEINTIPGFTQTSLLPKAAADIGLNFDQLCLRLLELAYGKKEKIRNTTTR